MQFGQWQTSFVKKIHLETCSLFTWKQHSILVVEIFPKNMHIFLGHLFLIHTFRVNFFPLRFINMVAMGLLGQTQRYVPVILPQGQNIIWYIFCQNPYQKVPLISTSICFKPYIRIFGKYYTRRDKGKSITIQLSFVFSNQPHMSSKCTF